MLPPVTKKFHDKSTDRFFQFSFYCDECGLGWISECYQFSMRDAPCESEGEKKARDIIWKSDHDAAYERANNEAILNFNKCPKCGQRVCDNCFSEFEPICLTCLDSETVNVNNKSI